MAEFFTTRGVSFVIDELIKNGKGDIYLITPYLKLSNTLFERLVSVINRNINVTLVYGKTDLNPIQNELLKKLNCNIYYKDNLHAKCYLNESEAIICSMNLHSFSEVNNVEMGVKISKKQDRKAYEDCYNEILDLIDNSTPIKINSKNTNSDNSIKFEYKEFVSSWIELIKNSYKKANITITEDKFEMVNFPFSNMKLSNSYGFVCLELSGHINQLRQLQQDHVDVFYDELKSYRCYWNHPYNRINLYHAKDLNFRNKEDAMKYCDEGLKKLIELAENHLVSNYTVV